MYRGDVRLGDTIDLLFTTRRFTTGAPFTLAGAPVISAYIGNGLTQITAGVTLGVDHDGVTGLNHVRVVATGGNGFAAATNVGLVITAGTVDSVSVVGETIGSFSIEARSALMPTTAARTLDVTAANKVNGVVLVDTVTTYTGNTPQTGDSFARLGAPAGASVSADLAAIEAQTDDIGAAGAGLTALATAANLATVAGYLDTEIAAVLADTNELQADWVNGGRLDLILDARASQVTVDAILVDTGTTLDAALAVVDANVDAILVDTGTTLQGEVDAIQADVAAILVDTGTTLDGRIPAALVGGRMDASVGAMAANVLTATAINADAITAAKVADGTIDAATFAPGAINAAAIATDAITAAKIAPDAIGASELAADAVTEIQSGLATGASLTTRANAIDAALVTIDDYIDTEVGAVVGFVDDLEARLTVSLTDKLAAHSAAVLILVVGAGSTTTAVKLGTVDGAAPSAVNDFYNGRVIVFTSGALAGQATSISDYDGATTIATVVALTAAPVDTVVGVIV